MDKKLISILISWLLYSVGTYIVLIPCHIFAQAFSISILLGLLFGMLNTLISNTDK